MQKAPLARLLRLPDDLQRQTVRAMLERHHTGELERKSPVVRLSARLLDDAIPAQARTFPDQAALAAEVTRLHPRLAGMSGVRICVDAKVGPAPRVPAAPKKIDEVRAAPGLPESDVREGASWTLQVSNKPRPSPVGAQ